MAGKQVDAQKVELLAEELTVHRVDRKIEHVHVSTHAELVPTRVEAPVTAEHITITRVPKNIEVAGPLPVRQEGDVTVISLVEEVAVVTVKYVLKEEVRIHKETKSSVRTIDVELRREYADITRDAGK